MKVDAHTHLTEDGRWLDGKRLASVEELLRQMDEVGIERSFVLPIAGSVPVSGILGAIKSHPDRLIGFGTLASRSWREDLEICDGEGLRGLKFHPRLQQETLEQLEAAGALEAISGLDLPLLVCGWLQSQAPGVPMSALAPDRVDELARRWPNLKLVLAHMGGHRLWDAVFCARSNENVYLDCSYFLSFFSGTSLVEDFWKAVPGIDRKLLFGSDFPEIELSGYAKAFGERLDATDCDRSGIWGRNALGLVGL